MKFNHLWYFNAFLHLFANFCTAFVISVVQIFAYTEHLAKLLNTLNNVEQPWTKMNKQKCKCCLSNSLCHTDYGHSLYDIVYSRMKEEGLKHNVVIQGISHKSLSESNYQLSLYFTNIYAAILGKIGGIPWAIRPTNPDDMIRAVI